MSTICELVTMAADASMWCVPLIPDRDAIAEMIGPGRWPARHIGLTYLLRSTGTRLYKIGITSDLVDRLRKLEAEHGPLEVVNWFEYTSPRDAEHALHHHLDKYRVYGEWFALDKEGLDEYYDMAGVLRYQDSIKRMVMGGSNAL